MAQKTKTKKTAKASKKVKAVDVDSTEDVKPEKTSQQSASRWFN